MIEHTTYILLNRSPVTAAAGLSVASAPEFGHYFPFFLPLSSGNFLGAGVAVCLGAAVGAALFMAIAVIFVQRERHILFFYLPIIDEDTQIWDQ